MQDSFELQCGDVVFTNCSPTEGHEQSGTRPVVIVSINAYNERSYMKFCVPVTSTFHDYPTNVEIREGEEPIHGYAEVGQFRTFDLGSRPYKKVGHLSDGCINEIRNTLRLALGF